MPATSLSSPIRALPKWLCLCFAGALLAFTALEAQTLPAELEAFTVEEAPSGDTTSLSPLARPVDSVFGEGLEVMDIPRSVSVLTPETMRQFGIEDFSDLDKFGAGTQRLNYFGLAGTPVLRGTRAGAFYNGMLRAYQRNDMPTSFGSLEALDIVRGPAPGHLDPTLVGGYINAIPKAPYFDEARGSVEFTVGRWDHYRAQVDYGAPTLALGVPAAYRVSLSAQNADSFFDNISNDYGSVYTAIKMRPADGITVYTGAEYYTFRSNENVGWNRTTQALIDDGRYVIGEPINITSAAWGGAADRRLVEFPGAFRTGIPNFSALVVPRAQMEAHLDSRVAAGEISSAQRSSLLGALLDLADPDDTARAYGQPLPSTGVADPAYTASPGYAADLATLSTNDNGGGYRYTQDYFDAGGTVVTENVSEHEVLADPDDFADSQDFIWFFDVEIDRNPDRKIKNQLFFEWLETDKNSSYGYASRTEQRVIADKLTITENLPFFNTRVDYGVSLRFTDALMLQDYFAEPFSRRDITQPGIDPNTLVVAGADTDPLGVNFWSATSAGGANVESQLFQMAVFGSFHSQINPWLSTFTSLRLENAWYDVGYPDEVDRASDAQRASVENSGSKDYWMAGFSPVVTVAPGVNIYGAIQLGTALHPTNGGPIFGEDNFTEAELYEVGIKTAFLDNRLVSSLSLYHWDQSRFNTREGTAEPLRASGAEFETALQVNERLALIGAVTSQRVRRRTDLGSGATNFSEEDWALNGGVLNLSFGSAGRPANNPDLIYPGFPELEAKFFALYQWENGLGVSGGPIWRDAYWHNFERTLEIPESLVWNANVFYRKDDWEFFLAMENITSEKTFLGSEPEFSPNTIITPGTPVSWKFTVKYYF